MRVLIAIVALSTASFGWAAETFELSKVKQPLTKQPKYNAEEPLYGLVAIGPKAQQRIWMVLDKSSADASDYNVLYADLNGNGDLTESGERIAAKSGGRVTFQLPDVTDPKTGESHTEFKLSISSRQPATHMVSLLWRGKQKFGGGYPQDPSDGYLRFAKQPQQAPILWLNGDGPFQFQRWYSDELQIGGADSLKVFLGLPGVGANSFCAFQRHVLPDDEPVLANLVYQDKDGSQQQAKSELKLRC